MAKLKRWLIIRHVRETIQEIAETREEALDQAENPGVIMITKETCVLDSDQADITQP